MPDLVTKVVLSVYYSLFYSQATRPKEGTIRHSTNYKWTYVLVISCYFVYSMYGVLQEMPLNYYEHLGVTKNQVDNGELRAVFRKLSMQYHPDRNTDSTSAEKFVEIRSMYETLNEPILRAAYERFGPRKGGVCQKCILFKDFLWSMGIMNFVVFYIGSSVVLILLNAVGKGQFGRYWRFVALMGMAMLEFALITNQDDIIPWFLPSKTISEKISVIHQLVFYAFMALSLFGPLFVAKEENIMESLEGLEKLSSILAKESRSNFSSFFEPFRNSEELLTILKKRMGKLAVELKLFEMDADYRKKYVSTMKKEL